MKWGERLKAKKKRSDKGARVILALLGVFLLLWNINTIGLYLLGDVAPAYDIQALRLGSRDDASVGHEYRFNISYHYKVGGVEYDGTNTGVRGPRLGPSYDKTVHYYPFAPRISSLFAEDAMSFWILLTTSFSLVLIALAVIPRRKEKTKMKWKRDSVPDEQPEQRVTMAWLMEHIDGYDDTLEEYYQNGWDKDDPSWECECGKWNTENFCESCGRARSR